jgi:hypothetical protein
MLASKRLLPDVSTIDDQLTAATVLVSAASAVALERRWLVSILPVGGVIGPVVGGIFAKRVRFPVGSVGDSE